MIRNPSTMFRCNMNPISHFSALLQQVLCDNFSSRVTTKKVTMEDPIREQRSVIKFLVKSGESPTKIFGKLQETFKECCLSRTQVFEWAKRFKDGRESIKSRINSMLIAFFDQNGLIHKEFVPPGQTVNSDFYISVLNRLR